jgi:hypothetical protein
MDNHATAMKKMEMGLSVCLWMIVWKKNKWKGWRQAFIYLSMKITPSSNMERINYAPFYVQHDDYKEPWSLLVKLDRCQISLLSIVYDNVFHMERKITSE